MARWHVLVPLVIVALVVSLLPGAAAVPESAEEISATRSDSDHRGPMLSGGAWLLIGLAVAAALAAGALLVHVVVRRRAAAGAGRPSSDEVEALAVVAALARET